MLSIGSQLALNNPAVLHSLVDSFFEGKKALVKERLMDSVKAIVDGLFEEMVGQVKEMLLPPKGEGSEQLLKKPSSVTSTPVKTQLTLPPSKMQTSTQPSKSNMIFATKSKPGPSSFSAQQPPFSGLYKQMAEEDGGGSYNSQLNKKTKTVTVELEIDHPLDEKDEVAFDDACGDIEFPNKSSATANNTPSGSKEQQQQQSGKFPCTEPDCGKQFRSGVDLKRHLRTHNNSKPFGCTFPGCTLEFSLRGNAIRHILNVHLKKKKPNDADKETEGEGNNNDEAPDPATYLSVKEELL